MKGSRGHGADGVEYAGFLILDIDPSPAVPWPLQGRNLGAPVPLDCPDFRRLPSGATTCWRMTHGVTQGVPEASGTALLAVTCNFRSAALSVVVQQPTAKILLRGGSACELKCCIGKCK